MPARKTSTHAPFLARLLPSPEDFNFLQIGVSFSKILQT